MRAPQENPTARTFCHGKIWDESAENRQIWLFLGHYDTKQVEMGTSSHTERHCSKMTQGLYFLKGTKPKLFLLSHTLSPRSHIMAFSSVRENVTPTHSWKLCWENVIVHYILLIIYNFIFVFHYIIVMNVDYYYDVIIGSLIEMSPIIIIIYWYYVWLMTMWQILLSPGSDVIDHYIT